jgi:hypothetical protein
VAREKTIKFPLLGARQSDKVIPTRNLGWRTGSGCSYPFRRCATASAGRDMSLEPSRRSFRKGRFPRKFLFNFFFDSLPLVHE